MVDAVLTDKKCICNNKTSLIAVDNFLDCNRFLLDRIRERNKQQKLFAMFTQLRVNNYKFPTILFRQIRARCDKKSFFFKPETLSSSFYW